MYFNARYMSPYLNRWLQPDSIVPDGDKASIVPLTVDFHEPQFLAQLNAENRYTLEHGFWFQLSAAEKREAKVHRGPLNPQALNRFSYVFGNPLKYTDPSGHDTVCSTDMSMCTGGVVHNYSSHDILIRGDILMADGRLVQGMIFRLAAGQSSTDLGVVDVDQIIVDSVSIDGHSSNEYVGLYDGASVELYDDQSTGGITISRLSISPPSVLIGGKWKSYRAVALDVKSTEGHADISATRFALDTAHALLIALSKWVDPRVIEYTCFDKCVYITQYKPQ
jgi:hypothetical protein